MRIPRAIMGLDSRRKQRRQSIDLRGPFCAGCHPFCGATIPRNSEQQQEAFRAAQDREARSAYQGIPRAWPWDSKGKAATAPPGCCRLETALTGNGKGPEGRTTPLVLCIVKKKGTTRGNLFGPACRPRRRLPGFAKNGAMLFCE